RTADILYPYRQDSDFAYVAGFPEPEAVCVLAPEAPEPFVLFVRPRDPERELWVGMRAGVEGALARYGANAAFKLEELEQVLPRFLEKTPQVWHTVRRDDPLAARLMALIRRAQEMQPRTGTGPTTIREPGDILHEMRLRKEPAELACLREAIAIACEAHRQAVRTATSTTPCWPRSSPPSPRSRRGRRSRPCTRRRSVSWPRRSSRTACSRARSTRRSRRRPIAASTCTARATGSDATCTTWGATP